MILAPVTTDGGIMLDMAKSPAERQAEFRASKRAAGLKLVSQLWCHPDDEPAIRTFAGELHEKRQRAAERKAKRAKVEDR